MLVQFAVENFLSFKDKAVLSMVASNDTRHPEHVCTVAGGLRILRCALLYGANASGKSNIVQALKAAVDLITQGIRPGKKIRLSPFRIIQGGPSKTIRFEFEVALAARRYSYGIVVTSGAVESEWLYSTDNGKESMYFERAPTSDKESKSAIQLGDVYGDHRQRVEFIAQGTRAEQPFLTEADAHEVEPIKPLVKWFRDQFYIIEADMPYQRLALDSREDEGFLRFLSDAVRDAGTGIDDLRIVTSPLELPTEKETPSIPPAAARLLSRQFSTLGSSVRHLDEDRHELVRLVASHKFDEAKSVELELSEESDGTIRLLHLLPALYLLRKSSTPSIFIFDELDRSLHPLLTRRYLEQFLSTGCSGAGGQLICTTHDTNLLTLSLLRPDEIWFVEKDAAKVSHLYSLAEFKPDKLERLADKLEQGYLNGRFGAIPFLGNPGQLGIDKKLGGSDGCKA